jgi:hypothetical protein
LPCSLLTLGREEWRMRVYSYNKNDMGTRFESVRGGSRGSNMPNPPQQSRPVVGTGALVTEYNAEPLKYFKDKLFSKARQDCTFTNRYSRKVYPVSAVPNSPSIVFNLEGKRYLRLARNLNSIADMICHISGLQYESYFLDKPILELRVRLIELQSRQKPGDNAMIGPVNNLLMSLFNGLDIKINDQPINPTNKYYAYRSLLTGKIQCPH